MFRLFRGITNDDLASHILRCNAELTREIGDLQNEVIALRKEVLVLQQRLIPPHYLDYIPAAKP